MSRFNKMRAHKDLSRSRAFILVTDRTSTISGEFQGLTRIQVLSALKSLMAELKVSTKEFEESFNPKAKPKRSLKRKSGK